VARLAARSYEAIRPGYYPEEHFATPELREKHPSALLYFVVPKEYRPDRRAGLIVFLHGGGRSTSLRAPQATLRFPSPSSPSGHASGDQFAATGMYCYPVKHNRWLSLNGVVRGNVELDELIPRDEGSFASWHLEYRRGEHRGASLDAVNRRDNRILVRTHNVARFTVWLHPRMIDVSRPVTIVVDGKAGFQGLVRPSLATALESYERRYDWGLVYPMKVVIDVPPKTP
jgi:hypothetical protein